MRHLRTATTRLVADPSNPGLAHGRIFLGPDGLAPWTVDRVKLTGSSPAKAQLLDTAGNGLQGTRQAQDDAIAGLGLTLGAGEQLTVYVFDGVAGATHTAEAWTA